MKNNERIRSALFISVILLPLVVLGIYHLAATKTPMYVKKTNAFNNRNNNNLKNQSSSNNSPTTSNQTQPSMSPQIGQSPALGPYISSLDNFSIQFNSYPQVVPGTDGAGYRYDAYIDGNIPTGQLFVLVDNNPYPSQQLLKNYESSFESSFNMSPVGPLNYGSFQGYPSIEGQYIDNQNSGYTAYATAFYTPSQEIILMGDNVSYQDFEAFANSYQNMK